MHIGGPGGAFPLPAWRAPGAPAQGPSESLRRRHANGFFRSLFTWSRECRIINGMSKIKDKTKEYKNITVNRKAFHDYEIIDKYEAGIMLVGSEVKSLREGKVNLKDSYVEMRVGEAFLMKAHISHYTNASYNNHEPERPRKLLLHKQELRKIDKKVKTRGVSVIPLRLYFSAKGLIKVEIAVAKGKRAYDKKQVIKDRDIRRDVDRELKNY